MPLLYRLAQQPRRFTAQFITAVLGPVLVLALGLAVAAGFALRSAAHQADRISAARQAQEVGLAVGGALDEMAQSQAGAAIWNSLVLELAIDPMCALAFEGERSSETAMKRPPRKPDEVLFGPKQLLSALAQGATILAGVLGLYLMSVPGLGAEQARAVAFIALVVANLTLALVGATGEEGRLFDPERRVYWFIASGLIAVLALIVAAPWLASIFYLAAPPPAYIAAAVVTGVVSGGWHWPLRSSALTPKRRLWPPRLGA